MDESLTGEFENCFFESTNEVELHQHGVQKGRVSAIPVRFFGADFNPLLQREEFFFFRHSGLLPCRARGAITHLPSLGLLPRYTR
jgi:hypothetical protein